MDLAIFKFKWTCNQNLDYSNSFEIKIKLKISQVNKLKKEIRLIFQKAYSLCFKNKNIFLIQMYRLLNQLANFNLKFILSGLVLMIRNKNNLLSKGLSYCVIEIYMLITKCIDYLTWKCERNENRYNIAEITSKMFSN